ncbi:MAG: hypothetical protein ABJB74_06130 [Gemmatimonas sp.]
MLNRERDPKVAQLMALPWTIRVSKDDENGLVAMVEELPDAIATGNTPEELERDFWQSLAESIRARLALGDEVPRPVRATKPLPSMVSVRLQPPVTTAAYLGAELVFG